jgi:hypothetical protein
MPSWGSLMKARRLWTSNPRTRCRSLSRRSGGGTL